MIEQIKDYLRITGTDEDAILNGIVVRGKANLNGLTGVSLDFDTDGLARNLLFDYCRYAYQNATEYFEENFSKEILRLQLQSAVIDNAVES